MILCANPKSSSLLFEKAFWIGNEMNFTLLCCEFQHVFSFTNRHEQLPTNFPIPDWIRLALLPLEMQQFEIIFRTYQYKMQKFLHMQTADKLIVGFFGSRKSHKCVNVSMEQLASKYGVFECQSMSVMTRVCARSEWIKFGSPDRHVTTSINWLVAMAQYSCDSSQIAHSAAVISCFELRWNFRKKLSSFVWSGSSFCRAKCRLWFGNLKQEILL